MLRRNRDDARAESPAKPAPYAAGASGDDELGPDERWLEELQSVTGLDFVTEPGVRTSVDVQRDFSQEWDAKVAHEEAQEVLAAEGASSPSAAAPSSFDVVVDADGTWSDWDSDALPPTWPGPREAPHAPPEPPSAPDIVSPPVTAPSSVLEAVRSSVSSVVAPRTPVAPTTEAADTPAPVPDPETGPDGAEAGVGLEDLQRAVGSLTTWVARLADRLDTTTAVPGVSLDQDALETMIAESVRRSVARAQPSESASARIELELRVLRDSVSDLTTRVVNDVRSLRAEVVGTDEVTKDLTGKLAHLDDVVGRAEARLAEAVDARAALDVDIKVLLANATAGEASGELVAWTDVMLLAHELRSRVDDVESQQRRFLRGLGEWRDGIALEVGMIRDSVRAIARRES